MARAEAREIQTVALMALGFGLVGIDRFLITTLYPVIAKDLQLDYADIGTITGALAIAWGVSALFTGSLADRIGRRAVLTGSLVVFSLLIGASGLATGLAGLVLVRVVMGFADGAYTPASITATLAASPEERHGRNIGIQQTPLPLFGLGLAPLLVAGLLHVIDWRYIFLVFVIPGLLLAWGVWRVIPPGVPRSTAAVGAAGQVERSSVGDWLAVLRYRNIRLGAVLMLCWLTCLITTSAFMPNYLTDHLHLPLTQMGIVMSAIGLGSMTGTLLLPWLSDAWGRKSVTILSAAGALLSLLALSQSPAVPPLLFACLFLVHFFNNAAITLTVGPLCSETVPPALAATATGLVIAVGELIGGGLAPVLVGQLAQQAGIDNVLYLPIGALALAVLLGTRLIETRHRARGAADLSPPRSAAG